MKTQRLEARALGVVLMSLTLACDGSNPPSAPAVGASGEASAQVDVRSNGRRIRWDIITENAAGAIAAGGKASARAENNLRIKLTGSGTFEPGEDEQVTGGGTWVTRNASGLVTGSGTYRVTELVRFHRAPATLGPGVPDRIANSARSTAGLAVFQIRYSDGSRGILVFSCGLGVTGVFEGITASKGFVDYWNRVPGGETLFHVLDGEDG